MNWKENKLVGIIGVAVIVGALLIALFPFIKNKWQNLRADQQNQGEQGYQDGLQREDGFSAESSLYSSHKFSEEKKLGDKQSGKRKKFNPFLTYKEREELKKLKREEVQRYREFVLSSIFYSSKKSYAIVDGRVVKENDIIGNYKILKIEPESIVLKDFLGKEYVLRLNNIYYEK
ncbi:MAG: hypothetical protein K9L84_03510 [Candidatus Omnitrophica bacterium]|nr:hypothetical protein [Candidatus Omnitrophota bacterium]MCF7894106.1 hypothetical protein [Candidatus Omnitrophota bacterium]